ncbi:MAG: hypothetical protein KJ694_22150, partial [Gammaproteobacteria bacterium]|nr:hypothetical protein [Gammaproteobacteria bacterium]
ALNYFVYEHPQNLNVENLNMENLDLGFQQLQSTHKQNISHSPTGCGQTPAEQPALIQSVPSQEQPQQKRESKRTPTPAAVVVFRENAHRYPAKSWYSEVATTVGEEQANLDFWGQVVFAYVGLGWNPTNIRGMLDFYRRREIPKINGRGNGQSALDKSMAAVQQVIAEARANERI